jgi:hypothetical protein
MCGLSAGAQDGPRLAMWVSLVMRRMPRGPGQQELHSLRVLQDKGGGLLQVVRTVTQYRLCMAWELSHRIVHQSTPQRCVAHMSSSSPVHLLRTWGDCTASRLTHYSSSSTLADSALASMIPAEKLLRSFRAHASRRRITHENQKPWESGRILMVTRAVRMPASDRGLRLDMSATRLDRMAQARRKSTAGATCRRPCTLTRTQQPTSATVCATSSLCQCT